MLYIHVWTKYLPIIKILLKRSSSGNQTLDMNRIDFERAGSGRKSGYKFSIELKNGKVANIISGSPLASDLATVLLGDASARAILDNMDVIVSLNTKFQLLIANQNPVEKPREELQLQNDQQTNNE